MASNKLSGIRLFLLRPKPPGVYPLEGRDQSVKGYRRSSSPVIFNTTLLENSETRDGRRFAQCTKSRIPCSLTEAIRVTIAGKETPLPRSAFADLGDISDAQITLKGHRVVLVIRGGDASESYIAKLSFIKGRLVERRMFSSEDSSHPFEISRYF